MVLGRNTFGSNYHIMRIAPKNEYQQILRDFAIDADTSLQPGHRSNQRTEKRGLSCTTCMMYAANNATLEKIATRDDTRVKKRDQAKRDTPAPTEPTTERNEPVGTERDSPQIFVLEIVCSWLDACGCCSDVGPTTPDNDWLVNRDSDMGDP